MLTRHPWIFVVLAFALIIAGWVFVITIANKNRPEKIPLEHLQQGSVGVPPTPQPESPTSDL